MRKYDPNIPLLFPHIPKCAGTSFVRLLRKWFGPEYRRTNKIDRKVQAMPKVETKLPDGSWDPTVKVINAHFDADRGYGLPEYYPDIPQYMTLLRDPFDIVVSMYFFAKGKSEKGEFFHEGKQVDITEHYKSVNDYVKDYPAWLYAQFPQDIKIENATAKIHEKFVYIGILEDLQTSLDRMAEIFGKPKEVLPLKNVSTYNEEIPESVREQFYADHPLLVTYYQIAKETYNLPIEQLPSICN